MKIERIRILVAALVMGGVLAACDRQPDTIAPVPATPAASLPSSDSPALPPGDSAALAEADRTFIQAALSSGLMEREASWLVADKTGNADVKTVAERLRDDHALVNARLAQLAGAHNVTVRDEVPPDARTRLNELGKLAGTELDNAFLAHFGVAAYEEYIALFERQAREGAAPDIRSFASETLTILREHQQAIRELQSKIATQGG